MTLLLSYWELVFDLTANFTTPPINLRNMFAVSLTLDVLCLEYYSLRADVNCFLLRGKSDFTNRAQVLKYPSGGGRGRTRSTTLDAFYSMKNTGLKFMKLPVVNVTKISRRNFRKREQLREVHTNFISKVAIPLKVEDCALFRHGCLTTSVSQCRLYHIHHAREMIQYK